ncbi:uncharacterized protein LOC133030581 [Cannabis sativa]|uniref:uncharacterized protein LOC133030581 n=1 Tax=Cannabis sativa TaxID=3483 RepID=UPI0029CA524A|nr:uncharacterized protein LOC133030581 [Cannabis sativa]
MDREDSPRRGPPKVARYFSNGNFLFAELGSNPSFIWRSVWEAKSLLSSGARRTIGDGKSTAILGVPWLPGLENQCITTDHPSLVGRKVDCLMKLCENPCSDCWCWSKEVSGEYPVRSAYKLLQQLNGSWPTAGAEKQWQQLWRLNVPAKVQHMVLLGAALNVDLTCPLCHVDVETISHILTQCDFAKSCWNISAIDFTGGGISDFASWFGDALLNKKTKIVEEMAMIAWRICWKSAQAQKAAPLLNVNYGNGREHWMKPMNHKFKINVDGAIFEAENSFGVGYVVRDLSAMLVEAGSISKFGVVAPEIAEAIGVKEALSWIKKQHLDDVEIETDS